MPVLKILGVRTAPQQIRYAIVVAEGGTHTLVNASSENLLPRPAEYEDKAPEHLYWAYQEVARILRQHPDVARVALKAPEYRSAQNYSSRLGDYLDASVQLAAVTAGVPIVSKLYSQMATRRADVKSHAEHRVGRTENHWNEQMADAVAVAWSASR